MKTVTLPLLYFYVSFEFECFRRPFHLFVDRGLPNIIQNLSLLATDNADPIRECRSDLCAISIRVSSFIVGNKSILLLIKNKSFATCTAPFILQFILPQYEQSTPDILHNIIRFLCAHQDSVRILLPSSTTVLFKPTASHLQQAIVTSTT